MAFKKKKVFWPWLAKVQRTEKGVKIEVSPIWHFKYFLPQCQLSEHTKKDLREMLDYILEPSGAFYANLCA